MTAIRVSTCCRASMLHHAVEEAKAHLGWGQPRQGSYREPREEQSAADLHSKVNRGIAVLATSPATDSPMQEISIREGGIGRTIPGQRMPAL